MEIAPGSRDKASFRVLHATTPVNPSGMHYSWFFAFGLPLTEAQIEKLRASTVAGFAEDEAMVTAVRQMMELDPREALMGKTRVCRASAIRLVLAPMR